MHVSDLGVNSLNSDHALTEISNRARAGLFVLSQYPKY